MSNRLDTAKETLEEALARLENFAAEIPHLLGEYQVENERLSQVAHEISKEMGAIIHDLEMPEAAQTPEKSVTEEADHA